MDEPQQPNPCIMSAEDRARVLQRLGGDENLFRELVVYFVEDGAQLLRQMRAAERAGDAAELERAAHSIKGLAASFEGRAAVEMAREIEALAHAGTTSSTAPLIDQLGQCIEQLLAALQAETAADPQPRT